MSSHTLPGSALTMLLAQQPPFIPVPAEVMTATWMSCARAEIRQPGKVLFCWAT